MFESSTAKATPITLVIADDHPLIIDGLKTALRKEKDIKVVGEARDGLELLEQVAAKKPRIVLTDIQMKGMSGLEATRIIKKQFPQTGVIALSMYDHGSLISDMMQAGADGYLIKNIVKEDIVKAIKAVNECKLFYSPEVSGCLIQSMRNSEQATVTPPVSFTDKEIEVMQYLCEELSTKEIAHKMHITVRTVDGIRERIQHKTGAKNMIGIALYALRKGIVKMGKSRTDEQGTRNIEC